MKFDGAGRKGNRMAKIKEKLEAAIGYECPKCGNEEIELKQSYCQICGEPLEWNEGGDIIPEQKRLTPYERTRRAVYATGNKWAMENFEATHN